MSVPVKVLDLVREEASKNLNDITTAVESIIKRLPKVLKEEFNEFCMETALRIAVRSLVHNWRCKSNSMFRYGEEEDEDSIEEESNGVPKVRRPPNPPLRSWGCEEARLIYQSAYDYKIAGRRLGSFTVNELTVVIESDRNRMEGIRNNVEALEKIQKMVPRAKWDQPVEKVVDEERLARLLKKKGLMTGTRERAAAVC